MKLVDELQLRKDMWIDLVKLKVTPHQALTYVQTPQIFVDVLNFVLVEDDPQTPFAFFIQTATTALGQCRCMIEHVFREIVCERLGGDDYLPPLGSRADDALRSVHWEVRGAELVLKVPGRQDLVTTDFTCDGSADYPFFLNFWPQGILAPEPLQELANLRGKSVWYTWGDGYASFFVDPIMTTPTSPFIEQP